MKQWFQKFRDRISASMAGRYGPDELSRILSITAFIILLLSCVETLRFLYIPAIALWIWSCARSLSRNTQKRRQELDAFLSARALRKRKWSERKTHRFYRCPNCKGTLRVPRGKGKIKITCPTCRHQIVKKT